MTPLRTLRLSLILGELARGPRTAEELKRVSGHPHASGVWRDLAGMLTQGRIRRRGARKTGKRGPKAYLIELISDKPKEKMR